jgi:S1-C subfamily serine protease
MRFPAVLFALQAGFLWAAPAAAETWEVAAATASGDTYSLNIDSVSQDGAVVTSWVKIEKEGSVLDFFKAKKSYKDTLQRRADDCRARKFAIVGFEYRDDKGGVVQTDSQPRSQWSFQDIVPGTVSQSLHDRACGLVRTSTEMKPTLLRRTLSDPGWQLVGQDPDGTAISLDPTSVVDQGGGPVTVTLRYELPRGSIIAGHRFQSMLGFMGVNCLTNVFLAGDTEYYDIDGKIVWRESVPENQTLVPKPITAGSVADNVKGFSCKIAATATKPSGPATPSSKLLGTGTGWFVASGYLVTANHVIAGAKQVFVVGADKTPRAARYVVSDATNDVAVLQVTDAGARLPEGLSFSRAPVALGAKIFTIGYPHFEVQGVAPKVTSGEVSSTSGMNDDPRLLQISAPVQAGNSGGPVFNMVGEVVGLVTGKLAAEKMLQSTGDLTENVNYAYKAKYVQVLLEDLPGSLAQPKKLPSGRPVEEVVAAVRDSVALVVTYGE